MPLFELPAPEQSLHVQVGGRQYGDEIVGRSTRIAEIRVYSFLDSRQSIAQPTSGDSAVGAEQFAIPKRLVKSDSWPAFWLAAFGDDCIKFVRATRGKEDRY